MGKNNTARNQPAVDAELDPGMVPAEEESTEQSQEATQEPQESEEQQPPAADNPATEEPPKEEPPQEDKPKEEPAKEEKNAKKVPIVLKKASSYRYGEYLFKKGEAVQVDAATAEILMGKSLFHD